jgi:hypothetical protein
MSNVFGIGETEPLRRSAPQGGFAGFWYNIFGLSAVRFPQPAIDVDSGLRRNDKIMMWGSLA